MNCKIVMILYVPLIPVNPSSIFSGSAPASRGPFYTCSWAILVNTPKRTKYAQFGGAEPGAVSVAGFALVHAGVRLVNVGDCQDVARRRGERVTVAISRSQHWRVESGRVDVPLVRHIRYSGRVAAERRRLTHVHECVHDRYREYRRSCIDNTQHHRPNYSCYLRKHSKPFLFNTLWRLKLRRRRQIPFKLIRVREKFAFYWCTDF